MAYGLGLRGLALSALGVCSVVRLRAVHGPFALEDDTPVLKYATVMWTYGADFSGAWAAVASHPKARAVPRRARDHHMRRGATPPDPNRKRPGRRSSGHAAINRTRRRTRSVSLLKACGRGACSSAAAMLCRAVCASWCAVWSLRMLLGIRGYLGFTG